LVVFGLPYAPPLNIHPMKMYYTIRLPNFMPILGNSW
jgi:hypothetical protein